MDAAEEGNFFTHVEIESVRNLGTEYFVEFCRDYQKMKRLELWNVTLTAETFDESDGSGDPPTHLKHLSLKDVCFKSVRAATVFESLAGDLGLKSLELGRVTIREGDDRLGNDMDRDINVDDLTTHGLEDEPEEDDDDEDEDDYDDEDDDEDDVDNDNNERFYGTDWYWPYDPEMSSRIVTKLLKPSVEQLSLTRLCRNSHFQAAMEAVQSSVMNLSVDIQRHVHAKLSILSLMIRGAVQLNHLQLRNLSYRPWLRPEPEFFQDVAACTTMTSVQLIRVHSQAVTQLEAIVKRNVELAHFVANPSTFSTDAVLRLVGHFANTTFSNSPSVLYLLARGMPAAISFDKSNKDSSLTEPKQKKLKASL